ncbi:multiple sugar transport system permease protein [Oscillospiraceae bacterium]|nr:multiple sugar transport system permease protein [Oscillospiraceae bacterium]
MDAEIRAQRRRAATLARRHVFTEVPPMTSFFDSMSKEERDAFFKKEKVRSVRVLKRRKVTKTIRITICMILAIAVAVFAIIPIFFTFLNSFMSSPEIKDNYGIIFESLSGHMADKGATYLTKTPTLKLVPQKVSIEQYKNLLFMSPTYLFKFWNSIILVVPIVAGQMAVACLASFSFARYRRKRREVLFFSYIILMLMPFQVTLVPNYMISDKLGILNTNWAIILPGIFSTFSIFLLTKYMRQIPSAYIEAAKLDGATEWQIFTKIALPTCKSAIFALTILLFIDYWNMVEQPLVLLTEVDKQPLSVFLSQINEAEIGIAFAASALYMIPPLLIFLWGEEYLVEGISRSGVK